MKETATQLPVDKTLVGTSPWRVEGVGLVTGTAKFTADIFLKGMLHAKIFVSPHAHTRQVCRNACAAIRAEAQPSEVNVDDDDSN